MCKRLGCAGSPWCKLCAAAVICYCGCRTQDSVSKKLGQLVWRRVHQTRGSRKTYVKDGRGCSRGLGMGRVQQAGVELVSLSEHGQDQALVF